MSCPWRLSHRSCRPHPRRRFPPFAKTHSWFRSASHRASLKPWHRLEPPAHPRARCDTRLTFPLNPCTLCCLHVEDAASAVLFSNLGSRHRAALLPGRTFQPSPATHSAPGTPVPWTFAVSGDSRNCGDFVMPAIAAKVKAESDSSTGTSGTSVGCRSPMRI